MCEDGRRRITARSLQVSLAEFLDELPALVALFRRQAALQLFVAPRFDGDLQFVGQFLLASRSFLSRDIECGDRFGREFFLQLIDYPRARFLIDAAYSGLELIGGNQPGVGGVKA